MNAPAVVGPREGEVVGDSPQRRLEILSEHDDLHATWSRFAAGREGADPHVHRRHCDVFYVLEGELTLRLGLDDEQVAAPAGTLALVPPLVVHGFRNASAADVRYLNLHAPGMRFADYLRALRDGRTLAYDQEEPPADGGRPTSEAVVRLAADDGAVGSMALVDVGEIGIASLCLDAGGPAEPQHVHRRHRRSFYVLCGELALLAGDGELRAGEGSWIQVPPGVPHAVASTGGERVRLLDVHTPSCGLGALDLEPPSDDPARAP